MTYRQTKVLQILILSQLGGVILVENKDAIENNLLWFVFTALAHTCYIQCKLSTALYKLLMASKHGKTNKWVINIFRGRRRSALCTLEVPTFFKAFTILKKLLVIQLTLAIHYGNNCCLLTIF